MAVTFLHSHTIPTPRPASTQHQQQQQLQRSQPTQMPSALITSPLLPTSPPPSLIILHDILALLDALYARNHAQHRRSHWWRSLHAFRKQMRLLLADLGLQRRAEREEKVLGRLRGLDERGVHGWYCTFSQLIPLPPFAMLGLVLMGCVARVCRITGITAVYEEIASRDVREVLGISDGAELAERFGGVLEGTEMSMVEDEGVIVGRDELIDTSR